MPTHANAHRDAAPLSPAKLRTKAPGRAARPPFGPAAEADQPAPLLRSAPESAESVMLPEEPFGVFGPAGEDLGDAGAATEEAGAAAGLESDAETESAVETETESQTEAQAPTGAEAAAAAPEEAVAQAPAAAPAPPPPALNLTGPRVLWRFNGENPSNYSISGRVRSNRAGGAFAWTVSAHLALSSATAAQPTITTVSSSPRNGARVSLRHTAADGKQTNAAYNLTVRAPATLMHLRNVDAADATWGYSTEIHYAIKDNLGTILPRNVEINEDFTAAPTADSAGMDWRRGGEGATTVGPTDWFDHVQGESAGHKPAPVGPTHANAGVAVYHWPGNWHVGSLTIGSGTKVKGVTWQKNRGYARHT